MFLFHFSDGLDSVKEEKTKKKKERNLPVTVSLKLDFAEDMLFVRDII